jgi:sulfur carrier protein ThiS
VNGNPIEMKESGMTLSDLLASVGKYDERLEK